MNNSVLISGVSGFVGQHLQKKLKNNFRVKGLSRVSNIGENIIDYSQLTKDELDKHNIFIHLAGISNANLKEKERLFKVNFELTKRLFNIFNESDCKCFIFFSSIKAVGEVSDDFFKEDTQPTPKTVYGESKLLAEKYILENLKKDKKVYILRPCMIYGKGKDGSVGLLTELIKKGFPYPFGKFENKRSYLSIDNLCFYIEKLIEERKAKSGIYNLSDDSFLSTNELVKIIGTSLNKKVKFLNVPKSIVKLITKVFGKPFSLKLEKLIGSCMVSNEKIKKELNISLPIDTKKGINEFIVSFRDL